MTVGCTLIYSMKRTPDGHVALVLDSNGKPKPYIYDSSQLTIVTPYFEEFVLMRTMPVTKRFIKEYQTKDSKAVEVRVVVKVQPKIQWIPELYTWFGRDYARGFLEKEATMDVQSVCSKYTLSQLLNASDQLLDEITEDIELRISDAATFFKLNLALESVLIADPEADE